MFERDCPYYMAMGMTYDEYWRGDPKLVLYYRKAARIRTEQKNEQLWLQGRYFYEALVSASVHFRDFLPENVDPHEYPAKPYRITPMTKEEMEQEEKEKEMALRQRINDAIAACNAKFSGSEVNSDA